MKKRSMMCVMRADEFGGPEVLKSVEVPIPQPGPGQVLIRVEAASVNFSDCCASKGLVLLLTWGFKVSRNLQNPGLSAKHGGL